jgi:ADP-heptose:LPS heptosyltransferase
MIKRILFRLIYLLSLIPNKKFKNFLKFIFNYGLKSIQKRSNKSTSLSQKCIILQKNDSIGDYILFRNFIQILKSATQFKDYYIVLIGNIIYKDIALNLDSQNIKKFIWIDRNLIKNKDYLFKIGFKVYSLQAEYFVNCLYSRESRFNFIVNCSSAKNKIAFLGDNANMSSAEEKAKSDISYNKLIEIPYSLLFEFERNKEFFQNIIEDKIGIKKPFINLNANIDAKKSKYILIFPGAGNVYRMWPKEYFCDLIDFIISKYSDLQIILSGSESEKELGLYFESKYKSNHNIKNLIGTTELYKSIALINNSLLVVSNESSAYHISVALNIPSICIMGGGHFRRFAPYPAYIKNVFNIEIYEEMNCYNCNWNCIYTINRQTAFPCINNIPVSKVIENVVKVLDIKFHSFSKL